MHMHVLMALPVAVGRVPVAAPPRQEIEQILDGSIGVDAAVVLLIELRADRVAMKDPIVWCARENAQSGILRAVGVLHAKVAIEGAVMAGKEANALPPPLPPQVAQCPDFRLSPEYDTLPLPD